MKKLILLVFSLTLFLVLIIGVADYGIAAIHKDIMPLPVTLVDNATMDTLRTDWLKTVEKSNIQDVETSLSGVFWLIIFILGIVIILGSWLFFTGVFKKFGLKVKLAVSHGGLVILAVVLGLGGYLYLSRVTAVSNMETAFLELNLMAAKIGMAQNSFLLHGIANKDYGNREIASIKKILKEYETDIASFKEKGRLTVEQERELKKMTGFVSDYEKKITEMVESYHEIEVVKEKLHQVREQVGQVLGKITMRHKMELEASKVNNDQQGIIYHGSLVEHLAAAEINFLQASHNATEFLLDKNVGRIEIIAQELGLFKAYLKALEDETRRPDEKAEAAQLDGLLEDYIKGVVTEIRVEAHIEKKASEVNGIINDIEVIAFRLSLHAQQVAEGMMTEAKNISIALIVFTLLAGILLSIYVSRGISRPVVRMAEAAAAISRGDLSQRLNMTSSDEVGQLAEALDNMADSLDKQEQKITKNLKNMETVLSEVSNSSIQIAGGSGQVANSSQSLSQGATEQAASLEEITSSMTEISAQTKTNAENASEANQLAVSARDAAESGNKQMESLISAMSEINDSSKEIGKIIKTIDDIAFQTNLLALNAAVEAARAGKHGKGFAVVAQEVRNLAGRSAKAAQETADLIDGSVKKTENGVHIVNLTAEALSNIMNGIAKVTDLMDGIAAAGYEQSLGIAQVNQGLSLVEQVTQQNTATAEETSSAAGELSSMADQLRQTLAHFSQSDSEVDSETLTQPEQIQRPKQLPQSAVETFFRDDSA